MLVELSKQAYIPGTSEAIGPNRHRRLPPDCADTCYVVGGAAFVGNKNLVHMAWPSLKGDKLITLPFDTAFFKEQEIPVDVVRPVFSPFTLSSEHIAKEVDNRNLVVEDNRIFRKDGIFYRGLDKQDLPKLKQVYEKCFGYPIAPDILLALFTQTGGHLGGIFEEGKMVGFTTILAANLLTEPHQKALFVDSVGVIPEKRHLHLGSFALEAVELAAINNDVSHIALTHKPELLPFYKKNGFQEVLWLEDVYGPGESRHYSIKTL